MAPYTIHANQTAVIELQSSDQEAPRLAVVWSLMRSVGLTLIGVLRFAGAVVRAALEGVDRDAVTRNCRADFSPPPAGTVLGGPLLL